MPNIALPNLRLLSKHHIPLHMQRLDCPGVPSLFFQLFLQTLLPQVRSELHQPEITRQGAFSNLPDGCASMILFWPSCMHWDLLKLESGAVSLCMLLSLTWTISCCRSGTGVKFCFCATIGRLPKQAVILSGQWSAYRLLHCAESIGHHCCLPFVLAPLDLTMALVTRNLLARDQAGESEDEPFRQPRQQP